MWYNSVEYSPIIYYKTISNTVSFDDSNGPLKLYSFLLYNW